MDHPPAYEEYADKPRPEWNWNNSKGSWVGVWGYDWADLIGIYLTTYFPDIKYEVWQPDYRADKIYSAEISQGVVHKQFPTFEKAYFFGLKRRTHFV